MTPSEEGTEEEHFEVRAHRRVAAEFHGPSVVVAGTADGGGGCCARLGVLLFRPKRSPSSSFRESSQRNLHHQDL